MHSLPIFATVSLVLAGCLAFGSEITEPRQPARPWSQPSADPWVFITYGCGFCSGQADVPESTATAVFPEGHVLFFQFGSGNAEGDETHISFKPGLASYETTLRGLLPRIENGYFQGRHVQVHDVSAGRVGSSDWDQIAQRLEDAVSDAQDPGPSDVSDCTDVGPLPVQLFGPNPQAVTLSTDHCGRANHHEGDPWHYIVTQTRALRHWIEKTNT